MYLIHNQFKTFLYHINFALFFGGNIFQYHGLNVSGQVSSKVMVHIITCYEYCFGLLYLFSYSFQTVGFAGYYLCSFV